MQWAARPREHEKQSTAFHVPQGTASAEQREHPSTYLASVPTVLAHAIAECSSAHGRASVRGAADAKNTLGTTKSCGRRPGRTALAVAVAVARGTCDLSCLNTLPALAYSAQGLA